jgi:hypothetical protein
MKFLPFSDNIEGFVNKFGLIFTLMVVYSGIFGHMSVANPPAKLTRLSNNMYFKMITLFIVAFTATRDVEIALVSIVLFVIAMNLLKTPEERRASGNFLNL